MSGPNESSRRSATPSVQIKTAKSDAGIKHARVTVMNFLPSHALLRGRSLPQTPPRIPPESLLSVAEANSNESGGGRLRARNSIGDRFGKG